MGANLFALVTLGAWLPIVVAIFAIRPAREAVIFSFVSGWLFIPGISIDLPGLPSYTKLTSTTVAAMIGALIFDGARVFSFRPRWYDVPTLIWCLCPFASSISAGKGPYDGLSAILDQIVGWGIPYILGRIYLADAEGARRLALGVAIGGLIYIPFCLFEIRLSPILRVWVYSIGRWEGTRLGGYRPSVFLDNGLQLGLWMTFSSLMAHRLWASGAVKRLRGYSFGLLTLALIITTVLCRSTGALTLLLAALCLLWSMRLVKKSWPIWILLAVPPSYCFARISGLWMGAEAVNIARSTVGDERAQSLEFRFLCEENHIVECLKRPIFGYSRFSEFVKWDAGDASKKIIDSYWIIAFGTSGLVGVIALNAMLLLPMAGIARRVPVASWSDPDVAPVVALGLFLTVFMIDCLANAMPNPVIALAIGAVSGIPIARRKGTPKEVEAALLRAPSLAEEGDLEGAEAAFRLAIESSTPGPDHRAIRAEALEGLGATLAESGRMDEAEHALEEALATRLDLASEGYDADRLADLAACHEFLARVLSGSGRSGRAIEERRKALDLRSALLAARPRDPGFRARRVAALNDLAWLLAAEADGAVHDPEAAVALATEATRETPEDPSCWNTLGVARYRAGDWAGAVEALEHSVALAPRGGDTAFDHYFLSMACRRLGEVDRARAWFDRAVAWSDRHRPGHPGLAAFRAEAAALLAGGTGRTLVRRKS